MSLVCRYLTKIFTIVLLLGARAAHADAYGVRELLDGFEGFFQPNAKYALEVSANQSDFPDDVLNSVLSEAELTLFEMTDFKINLQLQNKLEKLWQNSIEFNNADFEEIYQESSFEYLVLLELSPQAGSLEVTLRILDVSAEKFGQVAFSGGRANVQLDWSSINVATINLDEIQDMRDELEKLNRSVNIIEGPSSFAEHLHNARIHSENQNLSLARQSYQEAITLDQHYVDVLSSFGNLLFIQFGRDGALKYLDEYIKGELPAEAYLAILLGAKVDPQYLVDEAVKLGAIDNLSSAFWSIWIPQFLSSPIDLVFADTSASFCLSSVQLVVDKGWDVDVSYSTGEFYSNFLDLDMANFYATNSLQVFRTVSNNSGWFLGETGQLPSAVKKSC